MNRLDKTMLERRIRRLEKYIYEKTMGRGQNESTAFTVWKWLIDNGPSTREQVRAAFNTSALRFLSDGHREGAVIKNGKYYSANPDYEWEDVGKVNYKGPSADSITAALNDIPEDMLDELDSQEEVPKVNPNLFSADDIEEVKAAVESGQDVNTRNRNGQTALQRICVLYGRDDLLPTVKYLVENGADLNPSNTNLVTLALRNRNKEIAEYLIKKGIPLDKMAMLDAINADLSVDTIKSAMRGGFNSYDTHAIIKSLHDKFHSGELTSKEYSTLINRQLSFGDINTSDDAKIVFNNRMIEADLDVKATPITDYLVNEIKIFPMVLSIPFKDLTRAGMGLLYKYAQMITTRNLRVLYPNSFLQTMQSVLQTLDKDFSTLGLDEDFFKELASTMPQSVGLIAAESFNKNNTDILKIIANCGNMHLRELDNFTDWGAPKDTVDLYIKILTRNKYKDFSEESLRRIGKYSHKIFVEYIIDVGLADDLIEACKPHLSDQAKEALAEAGISIGKSRKSKKSIGTSGDVRYLVSLIENDDGFRNVEDALRRDPSLLEDPTVIEAIMDPRNDHSFTARELRKRLPKEDSTYDF